MTATRVLIVNIEPAKRDALFAVLDKLNCKISSCGALTNLLYQTKPGDQAVAVIRLPSPSEESLSQLWRVRKLNPWLSIVALLKPEAAATGISLIREDIVDQVTSPDNPAAIFSAIQSALVMRKLITIKSETLRQVKVLKTEQSRNRRRAAELEESYNATLENLMTALDLRDVETFGHSMTVAKYSCALAEILEIRGQ